MWKKFLHFSGKRFVVFVVGLALILSGCAQKADEIRDEGSAVGAEDSTAGVNEAPQTQNQNQAQDQPAAQTGEIAWEFTGESWRALGAAPVCPDPLELAAPVDLDAVTSVLYPGQTRGGNYKPHGGFRFAATTTDVSVKAPLPAQLVRGARYFEQGETQYLLEFVHPCGIMYRFDHLHTLMPKFQAVVDQFPPAQPDDSRTNNVTTDVTVTTGEQIATQVGFLSDGNISVDFGVYDLRQTNAVSAEAGWAAQHDKQLAAYGICWFNYLSPLDEVRIREFPAADAASGTQSDYCD